MEIKVHPGDHISTPQRVPLCYITVDKLEHVSEAYNGKLQLYFCGSEENSCIVLTQETASSLLDALLTIVWDKNSVDQE